MEKKINKIRELLFEYKTDEYIKNVITLIEQLSGFMSNNKKFIEILQYIEIGFNNKDYLLVGDLLKFELLPLIKNMGEFKNDKTIQ